MASTVPLGQMLPALKGPLSTWSRSSPSARCTSAVMGWFTTSPERHVLALSGVSWIETRSASPLPDTEMDDTEPLQTTSFFTGLRRQSPSLVEIVLPPLASGRTR